MRALWLPEVLRGAGLTVHEYTGWRTRGVESWGPLRGVICHATAGSRTSTDAGEMRVLWETGSTSAPAPISQMYLSRSGDWTVGASGRCNHVLVGDKGPHKGFGNSYLLGIEAQNDNRGEPWSSKMLDSYRRGVAAICRHEAWEAWRAVAHAEHQSGKSDPLGIDMTAFRATVAQLIEEDDMPTAAEVADAVIARLTHTVGEGDVAVKLGVQNAGDKISPKKALQYAWGYPEYLVKVAARMEPKIATILTAVTSGDVAAQVAELADQLTAVEAALGVAADERAAILALVEQVGSGERDAAQVVDEIARRLAA
jgi:hypothetical protein